MYHNVILPALISVLLAAPAVAIEPTLGARLGTSMVDISAALSADGYEMTSFAQAGDRIEIQAVKGGARHEVSIDARSGEVVNHARTPRQMDVYASKNGHRWQLNFDPRTGNILRIKAGD